MLIYVNIVNRGAAYFRMTSTIAPRPLAWVSTI